MEVGLCPCMLSIIISCTNNSPAMDLKMYLGVFVEKGVLTPISADMRLRVSYWSLYLKDPLKGSPQKGNIWLDPLSPYVLMISWAYALSITFTVWPPDALFRFLYLLKTIRPSCMLSQVK